MRKDITIVAENRESRGKNEARRLRAKGLTPAVVYGVNKDAVAVSVNPKEVTKILHSSTGANTIFNIEVNGTTEPVIIADWQNEPIKGKLLHVDLRRVDLTKSIKVKVPVHVTGDPKGVKIQGGLLEIITRDVEIECLPDDIPESFTVNVAELLIGQSVRAGDIPLGGSIKLTSSAETVIAHVVAIRTSTETDEAAAGATAEPEVIKKGKKEEEGGDKDKKK